MTAVPKLTKVVLVAGSNEHDDISKFAQYLVRAHGALEGDVYYCGAFVDEGHGWRFDNWGRAGIQLSGLKEVWRLG